jgi:hypothetical protein
MSRIPPADSIPELPPFYTAVQEFEDPTVADPYLAVLDGLKAQHLPVSPGQTVAITAGSRGISNIAEVTKAAVDWAKSCGATPIIVPAMGSHAGATAEGQAKLIADYGITAERMGAEIRSSMDVVELPQGDCPVPVYQDRHAAGCDHTLVINRIKIHTDFRGPYESGLFKMIAIGLGKQAQAMEIHRHYRTGTQPMMQRVAEQVLQVGNILGGVAIIENACDNTSQIHVMPASEIAAREPELLDISRSLMPRLPVDDIDILIVDQIGKNISGVGMDTNIIGRMYVNGRQDPERPRINKIMARSLTEATHGNGLGAGLADVVTRRLADAIDWAPTYENVYTAALVKRAFLPIVMETDAQALAFCSRVVGSIAAKDLRIVRIVDTLHLRNTIVSGPVADELRGCKTMRVGDGPVALFDGDSAMTDFPDHLF